MIIIRVVHFRDFSPNSLTERSQISTILSFLNLFRALSNMYTQYKLIKMTQLKPIRAPYIPAYDIRLLVVKNAIPTYILHILAAVSIRFEFLFFFSLSERWCEERTESENMDHLSDGLIGDLGLFCLSSQCSYNLVEGRLFS